VVENGKKIFIFVVKYLHFMTTFIGDYNCRIDEKGRVMLPSTFKKALSAEARDTFVVKKDIYEKCLVFFPMDEWERQVETIRANLNPYNKEHGTFLRGFYKGTAEIELDATNRLLIPKRLLEEAGITKEAVLAGQDGRIEVWAKDSYEKIEVGDAFANLAQKILGGNIQKPDKP
jgi:MraZ protein